MRYGYVGGDPVNRVDPTGLSATTEYAIQLRKDVSRIAALWVPTYGLILAQIPGLAIVRGMMELLLWLPDSPLFPPGPPSGPPQPPAPPEQPPPPDDPPGGDDGSGNDDEGQNEDDRVVFSDEIEQWIANNPGRPDRDMIRELDRGFRDVRPGKPLSGSDLTNAHVEALRQNLRGSIDITLRNNIQKGNYVNIEQQISLPRYRFLAHPALATEFNIFYSALQHERIPSQTSARLQDTLRITISDYQP